MGGLSLARKALEQLQAAYLSGSQAFTLSSLIREAARDASGPVEQALAEATSLREAVLKVSCRCPPITGDIFINPTSGSGYDLRQQTEREGGSLVPRGYEPNRAPSKW